MTPARGEPAPATFFSRQVYLIAVLALILIYFSPALAKTFIFRDAFNLFYPYKVVEQEHLQNFSVSLWNPYEVMGSPFVGELATSWFYPANVFYLIFPAGVAFRLYIVSHFFLAAVFMWLWLRGLRISPAAAAGGALSFTLSGYLLSQHGLPDLLTATAWLPGTLWMLTRYLQRRTLAWFLGFSASLAMPFLAGRAESVLIAAAAAGFWVLASEDAGNNLAARTRALFKILPLAGVIALALAMVQFLPSLELGAQSEKGAGYDLASAMLWSFHPKRLLEFLLPSPWGRFWPAQEYSGAELTGWKGYYPLALTEYLGLPILAGALIAFGRASRRRRLLFGGALVLIVLFAMGRYTFLFPLAYKLLPILHIFRYPEKAMALAVLLVSAAGAWGLDNAILFLERGLDRRRRRWLGLSAATLFILIAAVNIFGITQRFPSLVPSKLPPHYFLYQLDYALVISLLLVAIALAPSLRFLPRRSIRPLLLGLLAFDLLFANAWLIPYAEPAIYDATPESFRAIRDHDPGLLLHPPGRRPLGRERVMREPVTPSDRVLALIPGACGLEKFRRWELATLAPNFNFMHGIEEITGYTAAATSRYDQIMRAHLNVKTLALWNVRYAISPDSGSILETAGLETAGVRHDFGFKVFVIPHPFPRAYLIGRSVRVKKDAADFANLARLDFRQKVVIEQEAGLPAADRESDLPLTPANISSYEPEKIVIETAAERSAYLVLSDSDYPGWQAFVDGRPAPIFRANYLVRAVWLPAGRHEVRFQYQPLSFLAGLIISAAAWTILIAVLIGAGIGSRKKPPG